jgi:phosphate transport system substrate-binding protein
MALANMHFIVILFAVLAWQAKLDSDNTLRGYYSGATISDEVIVQRYWPWEEYSRLTKLDAPATLVLSEDYPIIDGATSFVPIYSAVVNEIFQVGDKKDLQNYMTCSKTSGAYDRLIRGEVDMIFVFQPSDGHLAAAQEAGIGLHLTPIAREAFVFFVNRFNPVSDLLLKQIQDIYQKKITNWQQVGGNNKRILPFQRPEDSGSQTAMLKDVMKDKELPLPLLAEYSGTLGSMYRGIAMYRDEEESIGYSFRFYTQVMVKYRRSDPRRYSRIGIGLPIDPDAEPIKLLSVNGIAPTVENIRNGSYPFTQDVYVVTAGTLNPHVRELIDWLLSLQGQELIEKVGYVGLR